MLGEQLTCTFGGVIHCAACNAGPLAVCGAGLAETAQKLNRYCS